LPRSTRTPDSSRSANRGACACVRSSGPAWLRPVARRKGSGEDSRSSRGVVDRVPDGGRHAAHLRRRHPPLRSRCVDPGGTRLASPDRFVVGAGALHLHVRVDGEVRRSLRRTHRHPCRRRRHDQQTAGRHAQALRVVRARRGSAVHRDRRHARDWLRLGHRAYRLDLARPRAAEMDRLSLHPARIVSDVLPLPAGRVVVRAHRRAAPPRCRARRGRRGHERLRDGRQPPSGGGQGWQAVNARGRQ